MAGFVLVGIALIVIVLGGSCWFFTSERTQHHPISNRLRKQADRERLVHQISRQIRQSLDLDEVMATTVAEVQRFLQADRVLIYRLWDNGTGCAIHETVLPPYPSVLGYTFPEEVFPQEYHQAYSLGKTRTITNVDRADVEDCLADFVKQFGVQAKLVVPIIQEHREADSQTSVDSQPYLWGLLIAHQCSHPRQWEPWEVDLMKQLATQVAIAIQQSELYNQLQQLNAQLEQRVQQRTAELATANASLRAEIVERQRTEIALRHTNDRLQALVTASPRAILMLDREGNVKIWNPAAEQIFGWTAAEAIDRPSPIHLDEPLEDYITLQDSVLQGKTYTRVELRRAKKDGTAIDLIFSAAPLLDTNGQISGIVALAHWESITVEVINYRKDGSEFWNEFNLVPVADARGWYSFIKGRFKSPVKWARAQLVWLYCH